MGDLMEIGKFASASGLSVDALRHYDEVGVLKPASVEPRTSYRRYHRDQVDDAWPSGRTSWRRCWPPPRRTS